MEHRSEKANVSNKDSSSKELVERAVLKLALGYQKEEIVWKDGVEEKRVCKEVGPNFTALKFWLETHAPEKWNTNENMAKDLIEATLAKMTQKELKDLLLAQDE